MQGPYWREMNAALSRVTPPSYKVMNPQKLNKDMLPIIKEMADDALEKHLKHASEAITGDGATKQRNSSS